MSAMRQRYMTIPPYDQPRIVVNLAIRILASDVAQMMKRNGDRIPSDHPHVIETAHRIMHNPESAREREWKADAYETAWSCYRRLKELKIFGDDQDDILYR